MATVAKTLSLHHFYIELEPSHYKPDKDTATNWFVFKTFIFVQTKDVSPGVNMFVLVLSAGNLWPTH